MEPTYDLIPSSTAGQPIKAWTRHVPVEWQAKQQLMNIAALPVVSGHVAVMPDVHLGKGATVGSVIPTKGAIIPAAVGVDIGCGMVAVETTLTATQLPDSLAPLRSAIERAVPVGFNCHNEPVDNLRTRTQKLWARFMLLDMEVSGALKGLDDVRASKQLGTLGGGNHFIEVCLDTSDRVWLMLHSGSRNIGKTMADVAIGWAREKIEARGVTLPDRDLAWLSEGEPEFAAYTQALAWAQDYAALNRDVMLDRVLYTVRGLLPPFEIVGEAINCHHNYASLEEHFGAKQWITRKGAVSAKAGELGIIPGSMGTRSYIVRGKGNADSYCSCSHGAGRRMSRGEAKRSFDETDIAIQLGDVECRRDAGIIDELPDAYKPIEDVMRSQADLVDVVATLKQVLCVKG